MESLSACTTHDIKPKAHNLQATYTVFLAGGPIVAGTIGGYIADSSLGWRWTFWIPGIMASGLFLLCLFLLPETLFDRDAELVGSESSSQTVPAEYGAALGTMEKLEETRVYGATHVSKHRPTMTFAQSIGFPKPKPGFSGYFLSLLLAFRFPGTIMVMLPYAGLVGLIVSTSTVAPTLLAAPPYLWGANAGLSNVGGLIGTLVGAAFIYFLSDWSQKRTSRQQRHGFAEPEQRLTLIMPSLVIAVGGSLVFGFAGQYPSPTSWLGIEFGYVCLLFGFEFNTLNMAQGMLCFSIMQIPSVGFNYIIEAYGAWAADCCEGRFPFVNCLLLTTLDSRWNCRLQSSDRLRVGVFCGYLGDGGRDCVAVWNICLAYGFIFTASHTRMALR